MRKRRTLAAIVLILVAAVGPWADEPGKSGIDAGVEVLGTMKVENDGTVHSLFDELSASLAANLSDHTELFARAEALELMGYDAGWTSGQEGAVSRDDGFDRTEVRLSSDVLEQAGLDPRATVNLRIGYGSRQHALVQEFTRYRFERSGTSGIDGVDLAVSLRLGETYAFTAAMNPASFGDGSERSRPDVFAAFSLENDHRGVSWGNLLHFTSSSMQLFCDSRASLENNRLYDDLSPGEALTLGIGGTLALEFAGIGIFGFGMTEYFLIEDRGAHDILQAQWGAGFRIPLLAGMHANLSGSNAMVLSDDEGSYMNFGLDVVCMLTDLFGLAGAAAVTGILDDTGLSAEGGLLLDFQGIELIAGYSHHAIFGDPKYAKGAFDKVEVRDGEAPGGGFFLTFGASF